MITFTDLRCILCISENAHTHREGDTIALCFRCCQTWGSCRTGECE